MKNVNPWLVGLLAVVIFVGQAGAEITGWSSDFTNTLKTAQASHRPVLVEFTAPWCPYCKTMENRIFKDQKVAEELNQFERTAVNIDNNAELAALHSVRGIPAFVIMDSEGEEVAKTSGFMEAEPFIQFLQQSATNLSFSVAQKAEFETKRAQIEALLNSSDPEAVQRGVAGLLDFCERKEKAYRNFGMEKLSVLAQRQPRVLLDGLRSPALMARIHVANLLRQKLGDGFNVDPWEKPEVREKGVLEWKSKLASNTHSK